MQRIALRLLGIIAVLALAVYLGSGEKSRYTTCGDNCPSGGCQACPCGTEQNYQDIASWCSQYSWNQTSCQCIVKHESAGNANAMHENGDASVDVGLWQINDFNWPSCSGGVAPCDPQANLECAKLVYQWGGNTWKFWVTCELCGVCDSN